MATTPDIAAIAALIGDRARAAMLTCLMAGKSFTATELGRAAKVTKPTASAHLSRLVAGRLVTVESLGRHRYFRLANEDIAGLIEQLTGVADRTGAVRIDCGPPDPALRKARVCYDHLAGELGVLVFDSLVEQGFLLPEDRALSLTGPGRKFFTGIGVDLAELENRRRPLCLPCLDWSARRHHLAGALGGAILGRCLTLGWARLATGSRAVVFSVQGERTLRSRFRLAGVAAEMRPA